MICVGNLFIGNISGAILCISMTTILLSWKPALPVLELGKVFIHTSPNQSTLANFTSTSGPKQKIKGFLAKKVVLLVILGISSRY